MMCRQNDDAGHTCEQVMTIFPLFKVKLLPELTHWLDGIKDSMTRIRLSKRLDKVQRGWLEDVAPVGEGVFEMREFFGPGWRMYDVQRSNVLMVMLGG